MVTYTDPESGLEIRLEFDLTLNSYRYLFSLDGKVTEDLLLPKDETRLGMNFLAAELLRKEVKRRAEAKEKAMTPLERARKYIHEASYHQVSDPILKVLACIVEHLEGK